MINRQEEAIQMKKLLSVLLVMLLLVGCGSGKDSDKDGDTPNPTEGATYKIGTAVLSTEKGTDAGEEDGAFEVNTYFAHVVLDGDKLVDVYIDVAQNKINFNAEDALTGFSAAGGKGTKKELGDDYNMKTYGNAVAEWYEQIESLEDWMIGKTVQEVLDMPTFERDAGHPAVPDVEDLKSSVTITVESYKEVVKMAAENAVEVEDVVKVGTRSITSAKQEGVEMNTNIATVAVNGNNEVVFVAIDVMQSGAEINGGVIKPKGVVLTKKQLGSDYGMTNNPAAVAEWDVQIKDLESWMIGKSVTDILAMELTDDSRPSVEDLQSKVTVTVDGYLAVVEKAAAAAEAVK